MTTTFQSVHDGAKYERLMLAEPRDWKAIVELEWRIGERNNASDEWLTPWVVRGRNFIRKRRNLELLHC